MSSGSLNPPVFYKNITFSTYSFLISSVNVRYYYNNNQWGAASQRKPDGSPMSESPQQLVKTADHKPHPQTF